MSTWVDLRRTNGITPENHRQAALGIRGRLMIGFIAVIFIFLLAIIITLITVGTARNYSKQVVNIELPSYNAMIDLSTLIYQSQLLTHFTILSNDRSVAELNTIWTTIETLETKIDDISKNWQENSYSRHWQQLKQSLMELKTAQLKITTIPDKTQAANDLHDHVRPLFVKITNQLNKISSVSYEELGILDVFSHQLQTGAKDVLNSLDNIQIILFIITIIGVLTAFIIAFYTARAITHHINLFRQQSSRIASGDLTQSIAIESFDEMGQLGNDLNIMTNSLANMTKEITQSCHNIVSTLEEVRHAVDAQSAGASEQASSINEITASLSEIEKSSTQTMEKAKSLRTAAEHTRERGQQGLEAVDQSVNGMNEVRDKVQMIAQTILDLSNKTQQVGEITSVVNNLAQQSKMLALNASIEAAKAGEAGKGFAVVAVEVKTLAEQSEQATSQVQKILEDIRQATEKAVMVTEEGTKGVDHGTTLVEQTGDVIRNLNEVIHETTLATQQIESAVRQESAGIEQITAGMSEINQVTASFVESVKQTTEAMNNLADIAKKLKAFVDNYKI